MTFFFFGAAEIMRRNVAERQGSAWGGVLPKEVNFSGENAPDINEKQHYRKNNAKAQNRNKHKKKKKNPSRWAKP